LRADFLHGSAGQRDYWQCESDLASYDATFAQRIGWKWDYVLAEISRRGWSPPRGELLDWGCGSGIASRAFLDHFGAGLFTSLRVWDRSPLAMKFAARRARAKYANLTVNTGSSEQPAILLLSHVITELTPEQTEALAGFVATAQCALWVEPGTYEASRALIAIRERLRTQLNVIAPCTHQEPCGILAPANERHWCHHFASPPPGVFLDGNWSRFALLLGLDLRDLPLSFLVLDQRPAPRLPAEATRVLGHPRIYKPHALLLSCDASGVRERKLTKRALPDEFKRLKKSDGEPLQVMKCEGEEVVSVKPFSSP
jgi:SAM-dependent methyltransferase